MKDPTDNRTDDLIISPGDTPIRRRGRPPKGDRAMTGAERKAASREARGLQAVTINLPIEVLAAVDQYRKFKDTTRDAAIEKALRNAYMRKR